MFRGFVKAVAESFRGLRIMIGSFFDYCDKLMKSEDGFENLLGVCLWMSGFLWTFFFISACILGTIYVNVTGILWLLANLGGLD